MAGYVQNNKNKLYEDENSVRFNHGI